MTLKILISGLLFFGLASPLVFGRITLPNAVVKVDPEQATRNAISSAYEYYKSDDYTRALADFTAAIDSVGFAQLSDELRHDALALAGYSALKQSAWKVAQRYLTTATGLPTAQADDWHKRPRASWALQDFRDSALCISTIAQRWPDSLADVNTRAIFGLAYVLEHNPTFATAYQQLLRSLFDAHWTDDGLQPSGFWFDLTRMLLQQNRDAAARAVAERIDSTRTFFGMRIDRRFDVLTRGVDFDADRSLAEELSKAKSRVASDPTKLQRVVDLQVLQLSALHFDEVLRADDAIFANVGEGDTRSQYSDFVDVYVWILDRRARALRGLGRWDEALQQQRRVVQHAGSDQHKVSK